MSNSEITKQAWVVARKRALELGGGSKVHFKAALDIVKSDSTEETTVKSSRKVATSTNVSADGAVSQGTKITKTVLDKVEVLFRSAERKQTSWGAWFLKNVTRQQAAIYISQHKFVRPLVNAAKEQKSLPLYQA